MDVDPVAVGMDKGVKGKALEVGEWVVIDTDFIYRKEDLDIESIHKQEDSTIEWLDSDQSYSIGFERRWQQERQGKVVEEYQKDEKGVDKGECTKSYELRSWEKGKKEEEER